MKSITYKKRLVSVISLINIIVGMTFAGSANAELTGKNYDVRVVSSQGDSFNSCFSFNSTSDLIIDNIIQATYSGKELDQNRQKWQAVTKPVAPTNTISLGLSGEASNGFIGQAQNIAGDAISSNGTTYNYRGKLRSEACPVFRQKGVRTNPFLK